MKELIALLRPLQRRIHAMVGRATLTALDDSGKFQTVQFNALPGETKNKVQRLQNFGLTSTPAVGAWMLFVCPMGDRALPIAIAVDEPAQRPLLEPGEAALYNSPTNYILMKADGSIIVQTGQTVTVNAPAGVKFVTPKLKCTGDIVDNCDANAESMASMRATYNQHRHNENDVTGEPTDIPDNLMDAEVAP